MKQIDLKDKVKYSIVCMVEKCNMIFLQYALKNKNKEDHKQIN